MIKFFRLATFFFYRWFLNTRDADIAFYKAKAFMTLVSFLHLLTLLVIFDQFDLIPIEDSDSRGRKKVVIFLVMLPIYLAISLLVRRKHMVKLKEEHKHDTPEKLKKAKYFLIAYVGGSFALGTVLVILFRT